MALQKCLASVGIVSLHFHVRIAVVDEVIFAVLRDSPHILFVVTG
jgi:hypothetical protein